MPSLHNLFKNILQSARNSPFWIMRFHFAQVAVVADVITDAILIQIGALLLFACEFFHEGERPPKMEHEFSLPPPML